MGGVDAELFETVSSLDLLNLIYQKELKTIFSYACIYSLDNLYHYQLLKGKGPLVNYQLYKL